MIFILILIILLSSCTSPTEVLPTTTLAVEVAAESTLPAEAYPLSLTVRTNSDAAVRARASLASAQEQALFILPTWMHYQVLVQSRLGAFASVECTLRDQPLTLCLVLSGDGNGSQDSRDTIYIDLDDPTADSAMVVPPLPAFVGDHLVVFADTIAPDSLRLTCLSLVEWTDLPSANHVSDSLASITLAAAYQEMDLREWHIPTVAEAQRLRSLYPADSVSFSTLNSLLTSASCAPLSVKDGSSNVRYLCDDAHRTFSFLPSTTISTAGTKSTSYRLRLLSHRSVKIAQ